MKIIYLIYIVSIFYSCQYENSETQKLQSDSNNFSSKLDNILQCEKGRNQIGYYDQDYVSIKIDSVLRINKKARIALTTSYGFKYYTNGIGKDTTLPYISDSIIILKNEFNNILKQDLIFRGKIKLLDSADICNLSHKFDDKQQIMSYFMEFKIEQSNRDYQILVMSARNWSPQYIGKNKHCVEAFPIENIDSIRLKKP